MCSFVSSAVPTIVFLCSCFFFLVVPDATEVQGSEGLVAAEGKTKTHGNDDAIHAQLAASRLRSYQQDRKGCCSKASSYLDSTMARCDEATRDQAEDA